MSKRGSAENKSNRNAQIRPDYLAPRKVITSDCEEPKWALPSAHQPSVELIYTHGAMEADKRPRKDVSAGAMLMVLPSASFNDPGNPRTMPEAVA